jgi:hypothetical protein
MRQSPVSDFSPWGVVDLRTITGDKTQRYALDFFSRYDYN